MMAAEAARFGLKVKANFSKKDRAGWTEQEKMMWRTQCQLGGEKKATKFMVKYFAKKNGEPEKKKESKPDAAALHLALTASAAAQEPKEQLPEPKSGSMACAGSIDWVTVGSASIAADDQNNLWGFHRISAPVQVRSVSSGPAARHVIAIDTDGCGWAWGRNCNGQLGLGDTEPRALPTRITELPDGCKAESASCGRHHTLLLAGSTVLSCGGNAAGQLGLGSVGPAEDGPRTKFKKVSSSWTGDATVKSVACGAEFSVAVSSAGVVASWGHPQYGQLGHGSDGEYIAKQGKTDYNFQKTPLAIDFGQSSGDSAIKIEEIACGNNHCVARTREGAVYTWGFGGYGRLGHRGSARDEMRPRMIEELDGGPARSSARMVRAGATCCYAVTYKGQTYHWGKTKQQGEAVTRPTPVPDLNGWKVRDIGVGNTHTVVAADSSLISWGPSPSYGSCGYGDPEKAGVKSSTRAKKVDSLEGVEVASIACSFAHTVVVVGIDQARKRTEDTEVAEVAEVAEDASGDSGDGCGGSGSGSAKNSEAEKKKQEVDGILDALPELKSYEIQRKKAVYRGPTAWILFMKAERAKIKAEEQAARKGNGVDPRTGKKKPRGLSFTALGEEIGHRWRALSEAEREEWELKEDALRKQAGFLSDSDDEGEKGGDSKIANGNKQAREGDGAPRSRAAKRRKLLAQREEEDAADWASICAQESEEDGAGEEDP